jgi:hypothetical protein
VRTDAVVTENGSSVVQLVFAAGAAYLVYDMTLKVKQRRKRTRPVDKQRTKYY